VKNGETKRASQKVLEMCTQVICVMIHSRSEMIVVRDLEEAPSPEYTSQYSGNEGPSAMYRYRWMMISYIRHLEHKLELRLRHRTVTSIMTHRLPTEANHWTSAYRSTTVGKI
jgi:hypothetical protein